MAVVHTIDCATRPSCPNGFRGIYWSIKSHQQGDPLVWDIDRQGGALYQTGYESDSAMAANGYVLHKQLVERRIPVLNATVLDRLLQNQYLIPSAWKSPVEGKIRKICFWGTVYNRQHYEFGLHQSVRCLVWDLDSWCEEEYILPNCTSKNMFAAMRAG